MRILAVAVLCAAAVLAARPRAPRRLLQITGGGPRPTSSRAVVDRSPLAVAGRSPVGSAPEASGGERPWWRFRRVRRGPPHGVPWPIVLDLLAAVLAAGAPVPGALRTVGRCLEEVSDPSADLVLEVARAVETGGTGRVDGRRDGPGSAAVAELLGTLRLSATTGLAPVALVQSDAAGQRGRRRAAQAVAAQRLGVLLVLPTGLCLLPAFVFLTVAPLVLDLLT